ncbi:MAG: HEAT repeat domain-containing protein, partial [Planctomycetota bacterium]
RPGSSQAIQPDSPQAKPSQDTAKPTQQQSEQTRTGLTLEDFKKIRPEMTLEDVYSLLGKPGRDVGSGLYVLEYVLVDGSAVHVGSYGVRVLYVKHGQKDLLTTALAATPPSPGVRATLILPKRTFLLGENVTATLRAKNATKTPVELTLGAHSMEAGSDQVIVLDASDKPLEYIGAHVDEWQTSFCKWHALSPGEETSRAVELTDVRLFDRTGKYRLRGYANVRKPGRYERVYSPWVEFELITGPEAFRKEVTFTHARPAGPKREHAAVIIYALPKAHVAYYRRAFQADGEQTVVYRRLVEVEPGHVPQLLKDNDGELHVLVTERPWTQAEAEARLLGLPELYRQRLNGRYYVWYHTWPADGRLREKRRAHVWNEHGLSLRLVLAANGEVELHEFTPDGKDRGPYRPRAPEDRPPFAPRAEAGGGKAEPAQSLDAVTAKLLATAMRTGRQEFVRGLTERLLAGDRRYAAAALTALLKTKGLAVHRSYLIGPIGRAGLKEAVPTLIELLDDDPDVRWWSAIALGQIGDRAAVGALERLLKAGGDANLRYRIRVALGQLGRSYTQYFIHGLADADENRRRAAMYALADIADTRAVPALYRMLYARRYWEGHEAARAIERLTGIKPNTVGKAGERPPRPMAEIRQDVRKWMAAHAEQLRRRVEPSPEAWPFSPPPVLFVDRVGQLRAGMTGAQVQKVLGMKAGEGSAEAEYYGPDVSGRSVMVIPPLTGTQHVLRKWKLGELPGPARRAAEALKKQPRLSLRLLEARWDRNFTDTVRNQRLWLDTSARELAKAPGTGHQLTPEQAAKVVEALATEGFFSPDSRQRLWPWPPTNDYPGGVWVLRVGGDGRIMGPGVTLLRLLHRLRPVVPADARQALDAVAAEIAGELGTSPYRLPVATPG